MWEATSGFASYTTLRQVLTCFMCRVRAAEVHGANPARNCASRSCRLVGHPVVSITCLVLILLLVWSGPSLPLASTYHPIQCAPEERISERTRIARELHDSLLQGFKD